jgi:hypothetical protein
LEEIDTNMYGSTVDLDFNNDPADINVSNTSNQTAVDIWIKNNPDYNQNDTHNEHMCKCPHGKGTISAGASGSSDGNKDTITNVGSNSESEDTDTLQELTFSEGGFEFKFTAIGDDHHKGMLRAMINNWRNDSNDTCTAVYMVDEGSFLGIQAEDRLTIWYFNCQTDLEAIMKEDVDVFDCIRKLFNSHFNGTIVNVSLVEWTHGKGLCDDSVGNKNIKTRRRLGSGQGDQQRVRIDLQFETATDAEEAAVEVCSPMFLAGLENCLGFVPENCEATRTTQSGVPINKPKKGGADEGLGGGAVAGIVIGVLLFVCIIAELVYYCFVY